MNQLETVLLKYKTCSRIVCEFPQDMSSSPVGYAAAKRGDIIKLSYLIGGMARASDLGDEGFVLIPVREWKGQLPKTVVKKRILIELGWQREVPEYMTPFDKKSMDHDWDAVGIGLYYFGRF